MQALSNDELRAKTKELQKYVQEYAKEEKAKIAELKAKIEDTPIDEREGIFNQIDKLEQEALDKYEVALNEVLPQVFAIVKDTARRFAENEETIVTLPTSTASWLLIQLTTSLPSMATRLSITTTGQPAVMI